MPTVKVLIDGVGQWNKGDIVKDAPPGLLHMAIVGTTNAATGELVAEILDGAIDDKEELKELKADAKRLKIEGYGKMNADELKSAIYAVGKALAAEEEAAKVKKEAEEAEAAIKALQAKAAELQIDGFETMTAEELTAAIEAAGGVSDGE